MKDLLKEIRFHYAEKLLSPTGIYVYQKRVENIPIVGETLLDNKWLHLNLNNGFH